MTAIRLTKQEVERLEEFVRKGHRSARALTRARILLLVNEGETEERVSEILHVCRATVCNIKRRYKEEGLESALSEKPRPGQPRKYTEIHEAEIIATACASPPEGKRRMTIMLILERLKKRKGFKTMNRETIRLVLKKARQNRGLGRCGAYHESPPSSEKGCTMS